MKISQAKVDENKLKAYTANIAKTCQPEGEPFGEVHDIVEKANPTQDEKCFITCTMTKWGLLSENGKFQPDGVRKVNEAIREFDDNPAEYKNADEAIIAKCSAIEKPEKCDKGYAIAECGFKVFDEIHG
ncbi:general odorant-binding protein 19d-like isoform X2 [Hermetia illucens]|uniref:general odorant-binding protein 19d-like isoform X2 n=1 Tax=Hermetia illucens TaxID=343691 RepID=UPI0018CC0C58|nr:general odorant-binding protein 19d-like isoform X2 [Hermetia illucens]